jgi:hypothetical protein
MTLDAAVRVGASEVQNVLATVIENPRLPLPEVLNRLYPGRTDLWTGTTKAIDRALGRSPKPVSKTRKAKAEDQSLVDRLVFSWQLLRKLDAAVRKLPIDPPAAATADLEVLRGALAEYLGEPVSEPFLIASLRLARLGERAQFARAYRSLLASNQPTSTLLPSGSDEDSRRLAFWLLRRRRDGWIDFSEDPPYVKVEETHIVEKVVEDLQKWISLAPDTSTILGSVAESEVEAWLRFCSLDSSSASALGPERVRSIVSQYRTIHNLQQLLIIYRAAPEGAVRELEAINRQLFDENRALEDQLRQARQEVSQTTASHGQVSGTEVADEASRLRDALRLIDAKYSLDSLESIQLGADTPLSLRAFVSHLLYVLRKHGLGPYPESTDFSLSYDQSGLFECSDFEVPPGGSVPVVVQKKGWAIVRGGRLFPVRKARLIRKETGEGS